MKIPDEVRVVFGDTTMSEIQCFCTDCYFNRIYNGEATCDLKTVIISNVKCKNYIVRTDANKIFDKENKQ